MILIKPDRKTTKSRDSTYNPLMRRKKKGSKQHSGRALLTLTSVEGRGLGGGQQGAEGSTLRITAVAVGQHHSDAAVQGDPGPHACVPPSRSRQCGKTSPQGGMPSFWGPGQQSKNGGQPGAMPRGELCTVSFRERRWGANTKFLQSRTLLLFLSS